MACDVEEPMPLVERIEAGSWAGGRGFGPDSRSQPPAKAHPTAEIL
jgi:hypothetical protein